MCVYLTLSAIIMLAEVQHMQFLKWCEYKEDNITSFNDVIGGAVVPEEETCRFCTPEP